MFNLLLNTSKDENNLFCENWRRLKGEWKFGFKQVDKGEIITVRTQNFGENIPIFILRNISVVLNLRQVLLNPNYEHGNKFLKP